MKCLECDYLKIETDDTKLGNAKCYLSSKRGKVITWACTVLFPTVYGIDRVKEELENKIKPPHWCKL